MLDVKRTVRTVVPSVPFARIAKRVLGASYALSLVLCGDSLARSLNRAYRKKDYTPNVLSFPLGERDGEIILNVRQSAREARMYGISERERLAYLFIHGCLHLKGLKHGRVMDRLEAMHMRLARGRS